MKHWEHKRRILGAHENHVTFLEEHAKDGWELCAIDRPFFYFKREYFLPSTSGRITPFNELNAASNLSEGQKP